MSLRAAAVALLLLSAPGQIAPGQIAPGQVAPGGDDAVAREWAVRRRARDLDAAQAGILADLGASGWNAWTKRAEALDALRRGLAAGVEAPKWVSPAILAALGDDHPNVRAGALRACAARGRDARLVRGDAQALVTDLLPEVRRALAECLGRTPCDEAAVFLLMLAFDEDEQVARAARRSLCGLGEPAASDQLVLLRRLGEDELLEVVRLLRRGAPARRVIDAMRAESAVPSSTRARTALLEALAFQLFGTGDRHHLIDGWITPGDRDPRRQEVLVAAGRSGDPALGEALLTALAGIAEPERLAPWPGLRFDVDARRDDETGVDLLHLRHDLFDAATLCLGAEGVAERLHALALDDATLAFLLRELGLHLDAWDPQRDAAWLACGEGGVARDVRLRAVEGFGLTLSASGDPGAAALCARALADADAVVSRVAFRALCELEDPSPWSGALHRSWRGSGDAERALRLGWLPRDALLLEFRDDLFGLGAEPGPERAQAAELLAPFRGDAGVRSVLEGWLAEELNLFERSDGAARRGTELRAMGCVRSLRKVDLAGAVPAIRAALDWSLGRSTEVGKIAAWALAAPRLADEHLADFLWSRVDSRTRIEAAIGLAKHGSAETRQGAIGALVDGLASSAWDLRVRIIDALGLLAPESEWVRGFLELKALGPRAHDPEDRARMVAVLADNLKEEPLAAFLARAMLAAPELDTRLVAVKRASRVAREPGVAKVLRGLVDGADGTEQAALLRIEALMALAEGGVFGADLERELLRAPFTVAAADLERRFQAENVANPAFAWRGELSIARRLAADGRLPDVLAASGPWWRLDARFLFQLGDRAAAGGDGATAAELYRAGLIGSVGERRTDRREVASARCKLLGILWQRGEWAGAARLAEGLFADWRAGRFNESVWEESFGAFDREAGIDPRARVEAAALQARARAALGRGEREAARAFADQASRRLGHSRLAAEEQAKLTAALRDG
ncbi:MAG: hypothetical protein O7B99_08040 [Planctomycetota bacterium]|nr:hypothetical protein [Planctomycetota bacterium]